MIFYSCRSPKKEASKWADAKPQGLITLNAGSCFGRCKVYKLEILESGKAIFTAIKNFERLGETTFDLKEDKLKELSTLLEEKGFHNLDNVYLSGARDLQVIEITYKEKVVKFHKMKAPQELVDILDFLRSIIKENDL